MGERRPPRWLANGTYVDIDPTPPGQDILPGTWIFEYQHSGQVVGEPTWQGYMVRPHSAVDVFGPVPLERLHPVRELGVRP